MKKLFRYFILFLVLFFIIGLLTNLAMKENFNNEPKHTVNVESPKIEVTENKSSYSHGYIKGSITNNTNEFLTNKYLQFDFYSKDGIYEGTEVKQIKTFNNNEKIPFNIDYNYENVDKIDIKFVDEVDKPQRKLSKLYEFFKYDSDDITKKIGLPIGLFLGITAILP